ncbi:sodium:solute symporter family transporter, partial [Candidatus Cardinium hertigii]|uniref:sodium:solute symporter family transporter n=1 Tax=Candidatus Cardinium hertigii TaxID=247481 RepID=UPI003D7D8AE0
TTYSGGGLVRNVECVHDIGLWWIMFNILNVVGYWLFGRLVLRMGTFMQHFSIADTIGSVYGKYPRIVIALVSICSGIVVIAAQITVMSQSIIICLRSIDPRVITIISTLLLIFYSTFGGVRSVTYTDVLQFETVAIDSYCNFC